MRGQKNFPTLKVSGNCPVVLLVEALLREGKVLGSEEGKVLGSGFSCEQRRKSEQRRYCVLSEF
jgi:hypothetical protein